MSTLSPYASELADARLEALRTLVDALNEAETPDEKRRCAVAIFNAPDPCELDDEIEFVEDDDDEEDDQNEDAEEGSDDVDSAITNGIEGANSPAEATSPHNPPASASDIRHRPSDIEYTPPCLHTHHPPPSSSSSATAGAKIPIPRTMPSTP